MLERTWGLDINSDVLQPAAYLHHYQQVQIRLHGKFIAFVDRQTVLDLADAVKFDRHLPMHRIKEDLKAPAPKWIVALNSDKAASKAIDFSIQLWLMVIPGPQMHIDNGLTLEEIVAQSFELPSTSLPLSATTFQYQRLSLDFGAKRTTKIGGIEVVGTSFLSEHLLFENGHVEVSGVFFFFENMEIQREASHSSVLIKFLDYHVN